MKEDGGVAICRDGNGERDRAWRTVMEGCHIPPIQNRTSRPSPPLRRLCSRILNCA